MIQKNYFFIIFLLISNILFSQKEQIKEIDHLLALSQKYSNINNQKSLEYAEKASIIAEKINNSEKKAYSYVYIAKRLVFMSKPKESLEYLEKSIDEYYTDSDALLQAMIKEMQAYNYSDLGFDSDALSEYHHILTLLKDQNSKDASLLKSKTYANIGSHYFINDNNNSKAFEYLTKAENICKSNILLNVNLNNELSDLYQLKGYIFLYADKNDSAYFYIKKAFDLIHKEPEVTKYSQYSTMGDYYFKIGNHNVAIDYYQKALEDMECHGFDDTVYKADIYNRLGLSYNALKDAENSKKYIQKYFSQKTITSYINSKSVEKAASLIQKEKENETAKKQEKYIFLILIIVAILFVLLIISIVRYKKIKKRKKYLFLTKEIEIQQKERIIIQKEEIIIQKEEENTELQQKLIYTLDEIKEMGMKNDPLFLVKFQEHFPKFQRTLLQINPDLQNSEFTLLAYIYLNFKTKEIADFIFKSPKTIQNRKHLLRKKLGIPSSEDLYVWLKSNCN